MQLSWLGVAPKSNDKCQKTDTQKRRWQRLEGCGQEPTSPGATMSWKSRRESPLEPLEGAQPYSTLILDFWPPEL